MTCANNTSRRNLEFAFLAFAGMAGLCLHASLLVNVGAGVTVAGLAPELALVAVGLTAHAAMRLWAPEADPFLLPLGTLLLGIGLAFATHLYPDGLGRQAAAALIAVAAMAACCVLVRHVGARGVLRHGRAWLYASLGVILAAWRPGYPWLVLQFGAASLAVAPVACLLSALYAASVAEEVGSEGWDGDPWQIARVASCAAPAVVLFLAGSPKCAGVALVAATVAMYARTGRSATAAIPLGALIALDIASVAFGNARIRLSAWMWPYGYQFDYGWQIIQAQEAIARGGLLGTGTGLGGALGYVPLAWSDAVFASVCEELGAIGGLCVIALYAMLLWRVALAGWDADGAARATVASMGSVVLTEAVMAVAGTVGLLPPVGGTLPLVAWSPTATVVTGAILGVALGVSCDDTSGPVPPAVLALPPAPEGGSVHTDGSEGVPACDAGTESASCLYGDAAQEHEGSVVSQPGRPPCPPDPDGSPSETANA